MICFAGNYVSAQDIHFSQYLNSPLSLNPAETGRFDGNWRFSNNYRNQWSSIGTPFKTVSIGFDKPFKIKSGAIALGVFFVNDKSGSSMLMSNKVLLSCTWHVKIGSNQNLGIGLQGGYVVKGFNIENLTFPSQYDETSGTFNTGMENHINQWDENINYPDINIGVVYSANIDNLSPVVGLSVFHVNNPKESFLREDNKLPPRIVAYSSMQINTSTEIFFTPHVLGMFHKGAKDILFGLNAGYLFPTKSIIEKCYFGLEGRTAFNTFDALSPVLGIGLYHFDIAVSYDVNISKLSNATNMKGALEFSIIYTDFTKVLETITLPCDRY